MVYGFRESCALSDCLFHTSDFVRFRSNSRDTSASLISQLRRRLCFGLSVCTILV
ncbi:hypothetical protein K438DRAFT_1808543, partial [Mycena galopus ATCC 62051]